MTDLLVHQNVTALCITNRTRFVPNIIAQWRRMWAHQLVVVVDYENASSNLVKSFYDMRVRDLGGKAMLGAPRIHQHHEADKSPLIQWPRVKIVVVLGRTTLGYCRNLAMRYADTPYITWFDDDDLQLFERVPRVLEHIREHDELFPDPHETNFLVAGGLPLIDATTVRYRNRPKKFAWLEGIYYRPSLKPFPHIGISEDYHWMQQFTTGEVEHEVLKDVPTLAAHVQHESNTSGVNKQSICAEAWLGSPPIEWRMALADWREYLNLGIELETGRSLSETL